MPEPLPGRVSAIISVYNGERYLAAAIESVLAQDQPPLELIVVDDGSTDGSARLAAGYPAVRCLSQGNQGNAAGKNTGLAAARGELIAFLDADDLWLPGKLAAQVAALRQHPRAGFTVGHMAFFFEPDVARPAWVPARFLSEPQPAYLPSGMLVRREVFAQVGHFDPDYPIINDLDWLVRARDAGVSDVLTPEVVVRRRVHGANLTYRAAERAQELLRLMHASTRRKATAPALEPPPALERPA